MEIYTPEEIAGQLKLTVRTIYKLIREGKLPATRIGREYRISDEQVERFMKSQEVKSEQDNG